MTNQNSLISNLLAALRFAREWGVVTNGAKPVDIGLITSVWMTFVEQPVAVGRLNWLAVAINDLNHQVGIVTFAGRPRSRRVPPPNDRVGIIALFGRIREQGNINVNVPIHAWCKVKPKAGITPHVECWKYLDLTRIFQRAIFHDIFINKVNASVQKTRQM
jgi:hypothetical protein